jgi:hypothetical protein
MKKLSPQQIIGHGRFSTLLRYKDFITYCSKRGIYISESNLETFERLGIFMPLLRVAYPKLQRKIERITENTYNPLGILEEGEVWNGETMKEYGHLFFSDTEEVSIWVKERLLYIPSRRKFQQWKNFIDEDGDRTVESYYSKFQVLSLEKVINKIKLPYSLADTILFGNKWNIDTFRKYFN